MSTGTTHFFILSKDHTLNNLTISIHYITKIKLVTQLAISLPNIYTNKFNIYKFVTIIHISKTGFITTTNFIIFYICYIILQS